MFEGKPQSYADEESGASAAPAEASAQTPVTSDPTLAAKFPQTENLIRFQGTDGLIHTAHSEEEAAQIRKDLHEAA